ncbi:MAG: flagellar basal body P-ring formation chaperone FlgA [Desulfobacterales bacterium]
MAKNINILFCLIFILGFLVPTGTAVAGKSKGPDIVRQGDQKIPESQFRELFHAYFCRNLNIKKADVEISRLNISGNVPVPSGKISYRLFQKGQRKFEGYVSVVAVIKVDNVVRNKVKISGWVDVFKYVVCASRDIERGEKINEDDLCMVKRNLSHLSAKILTGKNEIIGLIAKHNIKADTSLKEWMVERAPVVERGDIVTILAESGDLLVTVPGKVLMKGFSGELVKVQNLMSKKEIFAKVVNHSTVSVTF